MLGRATKEISAEIMMNYIQFISDQLELASYTHDSCVLSHWEMERNKQQQYIIFREDFPSSCCDSRLHKSQMVIGRECFASS